MTNKLSDSFLKAFDATASRFENKEVVSESTDAQVIQYKINEVNGKINAARIGGVGHIGKLTEERSRLQSALDQLDESASLLKDYQEMKSQGKKDSNIVDVLMSMPKYKKMSRDQMAKVIGDAKRKGIFKEAFEATELDMSLLEASGIEKKMADKIKKVFDAMSTEDRAAFMKSYLKNPKAAIEYMTDQIMKGVKAAGGMNMKEALDPVNPKELKGKHSERKDKDIDNDGDVDSSDEYLHNRRKAIAKAMKSEGKKLSAKDMKNALASDEAKAKPKDAVSLKKAPWDMKKEELDLDAAPVFVPCDHCKTESKCIAANKCLGTGSKINEAKMTDADVLKAAKALAANGKDDKTKEFGQGLVDFYKENDSFTPAQVGGLQNVMKNASFQMAKEGVSNSLSSVLYEKAMSKAQQMAAGAALSAKRGDKSPSELVGSSKEMYDSMTEKELEDFAKTKHKGLPDRVAESAELDEAVAKIACLKCDEVSTAAAWKKKGGFCPKCKTSSQGVAESVELDAKAQRALSARKIQQDAKVKAGIPLRRPGEGLAAYVTRKAKAQAKMQKEEVELDEAVKIGSKVRIHAPGKDYHGKVGHVGEIRRGAFAKAPPSYTIDYREPGEDRNRSVMLSKEKIKLHKESVELDEAKKDWDYTGEQSELIKKAKEAGIEIRYKDKFVKGQKAIGPRMPRKENVANLTRALANGEKTVTVFREEIELDEAKKLSTSDFAKIVAQRLDSQKSKIHRYDQIAAIKKAINATPQKNLATDREFIDDILDILYDKHNFREEVELDEAKGDYTINHKTFSSAVQHAKAQVEKQGYTFDDDEWDRKVAMGPKKPGTGKTNRYTIDLMKGGKESRRKLQMQVYYDEGRYELNMYIS